MDKEMRVKLNKFIRHLIKLDQIEKSHLIERE